MSLDDSFGGGAPSFCGGCVLFFAFAYNGSVVGACGPAESGILVGSTFPLLLCPLACCSAVAGFDVDPIANTGLFFSFLCLDLLCANRLFTTTFTIFYHHFLIYVLFHV